MLFIGCGAICISIFFPFISTVAVAAIFAVVLNPLVVRIQHLRIFGLTVASRKKCTAILMFCMLTLFVVPFTVMGVRIYSYFSEYSDNTNAKQEFALKFSQYIFRMDEQFTRYISRFGLKRQLGAADQSGELAQKAANIVFDRTAFFLQQIPNLLTASLIFFIALFYLLSETEKIKRFFQRLGIFSFREINIIGESLKRSSYSAVVSTILAGIVHGLIIATGAHVAGVGEFSIVFMLTFMLSFVPVIGAALVAVGLCVPALVDQNYAGALSLLILALFASAIDNIVRPLFLVYGNNNTIHPFIALLSVLGGIYVLGIGGLFIGPVLVQVTIQSLPKLVRLAPNPRTGNMKRELKAVSSNNEINPIS